MCVATAVTVFSSTSVDSKSVHGRIRWSICDVVETGAHLGNQRFPKDLVLCFGVHDGIDICVGDEPRSASDFIFELPRCPPGISNEEAEPALELLARFQEGAHPIEIAAHEQAWLYSNSIWSSLYGVEVVEI